MNSHQTSVQMTGGDSSDSQRQYSSLQSNQQHTQVSHQSSPYLDTLAREQISLNTQQNSSSSRKYTSRSCWEQHQIDDFFENFHQYIIIKYCQPIPLRSKYTYNGRLYEIFQAVSKEESAQKKLISQQNRMNQQSTSRSDLMDEHQKSVASNSQSPPQLLSEAISNNNLHINANGNNFQTNYVRTETGNNEYGYFQQHQNIQQQQRRIRTQSCDTGDDAFLLLQQQQQFRQNQQQFKMQQQMQPANSMRGRFSRKINIEHQYPNLVQEKRMPLQKQNNNFFINGNNPLQQQHSIQSNSFSRQSSNNSIGFSKSSISNPFFISNQGKKPRSITINPNQVNYTQNNTQAFYQNGIVNNNNNNTNNNITKDIIQLNNQQENSKENYQQLQVNKENYASNHPVHTVGSSFNYPQQDNLLIKDNFQAYFSQNNQNNKENMNPNINIQNIQNQQNNNNYQSNIQQVSNKEFEMAHENLKKRIENIQANVKVSKADFMKRLYQNFAGNPSCQTSFQSIDVSQLPQSNPTTQNNQQITMMNQQKSQSLLQQFSENFHINHNTIENPINQFHSNNLVTITSQPQSRQVSSNNSNCNNNNEDHLNRNHLNNKFRTFAGRKALVEKEKQPFQTSSISNHPLAEQLRERVKKQWEINRENIVIPQQQILQKNQNNAKQYIQFQQQPNPIIHQQQNFQFAQNLHPSTQMQYKPIKRIY